MFVLSPPDGSPASKWPLQSAETQLSPPETFTFIFGSSKAKGASIIKLTAITYKYVHE